MQVDIIYNIIVNLLLYHKLHISNGDICGTEREIVIKCLSEINTVRKLELSSMTKYWIFRYKESVYSTHAWIKFSILTHGIT